MNSFDLKFLTEKQLESLREKLEELRYLHKIKAYTRKYLNETSGRRSKVERIYPFFLRALLLIRRAVARAHKMKDKLPSSVRDKLEKVIYYANIIVDIKRGELWRAKYNILDPNIQPKDMVNRFINNFRDLLESELFTDKEKQAGMDIIKYMVSV